MREVEVKFVRVDCLALLLITAVVAATVFAVAAIWGEDYPSAPF